MNLLCRLFGHKIGLMPVVMEFQFKPCGDTWHKITYSSDTSSCLRCKRIVRIPNITIGDENTCIKYGESWEVGTLAMWAPK